MLVVVKNAPFTDVIASPIQFFDQRIFSSTNLLVHDFFAFPVQGPQRWRALEHQVLEKVGRPEISLRFVERTHVGENLADDSMIFRALDDEQAAIDTAAEAGLDPSDVAAIALVRKPSFGVAITNAFRIQFR